MMMTSKVSGMLVYDNAAFVAGDWLWARRSVWQPDSAGRHPHPPQGNVGRFVGQDAILRGGF